MNATDHDDESPGAEHDFLRSDPDQRRKVQWLIATMVAVALLFWLFGLPALRRWTDVGDVAVMTHRMGLVFYGLCALLLATAMYAGWYAQRIFRASQFPPPGSWVLRDTRLLRGDHARARGWWVVVCAISFLLLAIYAAMLPQRLAGLLALPPTPHAARQIAPPHG